MLFWINDLPLQNYGISVTQRSVTHLLLCKTPFLHNCDTDLNAVNGGKSGGIPSNSGQIANFAKID
jgi:hypothetical protein